MTDLRDRFRSLDRMPAPDLWAETERRAERPDLCPVVPRWSWLGNSRASDGPATGRRSVLALAMLLMALALIGGAIILGALLLRETSPRFPDSAPLSLSLARTGSLVTRRCGHAAVRLADGRVLIVGGWTPDPSVAPTPGASPTAGAPILTFAATAEVYDPVTGTFRQVEGTTNGGDGTSATLLADGRVLIAGGRGLAAGNHPGNGGCGVTFSTTPYDKPDDEIAAAYVYDPTTDRIEPTGSLLTARSGHVAVRLDDGHVLVAGGNGPRDDGTHGSLSSAELYDLVSGTFAATGSMASKRGWYRANGSQDMPWATRLPNGSVLVNCGTQFADDIGPDLYDPKTGTFGKTASDVGSSSPTWAVDCFVSGDRFANNPDWSPDGSLISFSSPIPGGEPGGDLNDIWVIRPDGSDLRQVTDVAASGGTALQPAITPDGTRIMMKLTDDRIGATDAIATIALEGTDLQPATSSGYLLGWHPRLRP